MHAKKITETAMRLRLPKDLRDRIERGAKEGTRSMNREVIHQLRLSYSLQDVRQRRMAG